MLTREGERTIEQRRAAHALEFVKGLEAEGSHKYGKFRSYVSRLPAIIVMNGLGQAMATELASKEKGHDKLFNAVEEWLLKEVNAYPESSDLMKAITTHSQDEYIRSQAEALAYLVWLKKFSQAYLKGED